MRRAVSCKYISTTPTVSVMETKMGNNLRENESEDGRLDVPCPAVRIGAAEYGNMRGFFFSLSPSEMGYLRQLLCNVVELILSDNLFLMQTTNWM